MNSKQRRVARRRIEVYVGGFESAGTSAAAAARSLRNFGLSIREINQAWLRAVGGENVAGALAAQRTSPFPVQKVVKETTPY